MDGVIIHLQSIAVLSALVGLMSFDLWMLRGGKSRRSEAEAGESKSNQSVVERSIDE